MATYKQIEKEMYDCMEGKVKKHLQGNVMDWLSEFGEENYVINSVICDLLKRLPNDFIEFDNEGNETTYEDYKKWNINYDKIKKDIMPTIREMGERIDTRGGKDAMVANYYIMFNFMMETKEDKIKVRMLNPMFDNIGELKN